MAFFDALGVMAPLVPLGSTSDPFCDADVARDGIAGMLLEWFAVVGARHVFGLHRLLVSEKW